jgi:hypothetical protein
MLALVHTALGDATQHEQAKGIALGLHAALPADQKPWCESTLQQMR